MVQVNFARKEVNCKIVYYGPGLSGKTTNIEVIYEKAPKENRGELTSIATEGDRTLFFDFMPLELGNVAGMNTKFQLYTVPGQVYYNSTRKLVLQGADGIVFVADSQVNKLEENLESLQNLEENLREYGMDIATMPIVLQYNKRDLPNVMSVEFMNEKLNKWSHPYFEATAFQGIGVFQTLKALAGMVLDSINKGDRRPSTAATPKAGQPAASPGGPPPGGPPPGGPPPGGPPPGGYGGPPPGGPPPGGYGGPPPGGYGGPPQGGPPQGYGGPPQGGYGGPPPGYGGPPPGYGGPPQGGYGGPPPGYGGPPPGGGYPNAPRPGGGYATPPPGIPARPGGYAVPPPGLRPYNSSPGMVPRPGAYGAPPPGNPNSSGYGSPPPGYGAPPGGGGYGYGAPPPGGGYGAPPGGGYGAPPPGGGYPNAPRPGGGARPPEMTTAGPAPRPPYPPRGGMPPPAAKPGGPKTQQNPFYPDKEKK